jgi:hypothetical protein
VALSFVLSPRYRSTLPLPLSLNISLQFPCRSFNIYPEQLLYITRSLLPVDIHLEIVQMPVTSNISSYSWKTIVSSILMALGLCSSTILLFSSLYRRLCEEAALIPTATILYASYSSVFGISMCRLVSIRLASCVSTAGCLGW